VTDEQKRVLKMTAADLGTTVQDLTIACYNVGWSLLGLEPFDPGCPIELPKKKRKSKQGDA
jgi:hypothetical protein